MKVGDIVRPNPGHYLRSGSEMYGGAIVLSVEPFVLTSEHGDMRWQSTVSPENFHVAGEVDAEHLARVMRRLEG